MHAAERRDRVIQAVANLHSARQLVIDAERELDALITPPSAFTSLADGASAILKKREGLRREPVHLGDGNEPLLNSSQA